MTAYDDLTFAPVLLSDMFRIHAGSGRDKRESGPVPYVAASFQNNGVVGYVDDAKYPGGWLSFVKDGDGGAGTCFYQPAAFWPSNHVFGLEPLSERVTEPALVVMAATITHQCFPKYNRGFAANSNRLSRQKIMVPVATDDSGEQVVDWEGMTRLGEELMAQAITHTHSARTSYTVDADADLPYLRFEPMFITDVFETIKSSTAWFDKVHLRGGEPKIPYLSQTHSANSIAAIVADQGITPEAANCITVTLKTQATFYQPVPFYTAQNFLIFRHELLNAHSGLLLTAIMRGAMQKFSWGYGVSMARLAKTRIMVPVTTDDAGEQVVDWEGMTEYGRILRARAERSIDRIVVGKIRT